MDDVKLKPCPFCGSTKLKINWKTRKTRYSTYECFCYRTLSVRCNVCKARGGAVSGEIGAHDTEEHKKLKAKAVEAWNRRAESEK